ncbi:MAG: T9SS type A sorting domain-containing protein [Vicingaceae bacterium]
MKNFILIPFLFCVLFVNAQNFGTVYATEVANMPIPIANNAVTEGWKDGTPYMYSFGGIDSTKIWSGITNKSFRYNTLTDVWDTIPDLPNVNAVIAAGASYVDSIIYIIGGYQVLSNGNEVSSNIVNRFDPRTNTYLSDGANIPVATDDHVQAVYNDSLIYVITGWSNTGNIPNVQIYDPANDNWLTGTPVPNNNTYKAFGATGIIIDNTIYYHGGASMATNFPGQSRLIAGQINPNDPTQITWSSFMFTNYVSYRAATIYDSWSNLPLFIGGSDITYNYNGIAYNGSGGVEPKEFSIGFDVSSSLPLGYGETENIVTLNSTPFNDVILPMDIRGVAFPFQPINYIAGGMWRNQKVSNKTFKLELQHSTLISEAIQPLDFQLYPNPTSELVNLIFKTTKNKTIKLINVVGKSVFKTTTNTTSFQLDVAKYPKGIYFIKLESEKGISSQKIVIQ